MSYQWTHGLSDVDKMLRSDELKDKVETMADQMAGDLPILSKSWGLGFDAANKITYVQVCVVVQERGKPLEIAGEYPLFDFNDPREGCERDGSFA